MSSVLSVLTPPSLHINKFSPFSLTEPRFLSSVHEQPLIHPWLSLCETCALSKHFFSASQSGSGFVYCWLQPFSVWSFHVLEGVIQINHVVVKVESRRIYYGLFRRGNYTGDGHFVCYKREVQVASNIDLTHNLSKSSLCPPHGFKFRSEPPHEGNTLSFDQNQGNLHPV